MAKQVYNEKISRQTPWDGDATTGNKPVAGRRVEEYIKGEITSLEERLSDVRPIREMEADYNEDEQKVTLRLLSDDDREIASCDIPALGGAGGGESSATKSVLTVQSSADKVKQGGAVRLTYTYDLQYIAGDDAGESTGQRFNVELKVTNGMATVYTESLTDVPGDTRTADIGSYLLAGDNYATVTITWNEVDGEGNIKGKRKTKTAKISVIALTLNSDFNLNQVLERAGYGNETVSIPYTVAGGTGSEVKSVWLYVDGAETQHAEISVAEPVRGEFLLSMADMSTGQHSVQMVATLDAGNGQQMRSESIYIAIFKGSGSAAVVLKAINADGTIATGAGHMLPQLTCAAFETLTFDYGVYDPAHNPATAIVSVDGTERQRMAVGRTTQTYSERYTGSGSHTIGIACGSAQMTATVQVKAGAITLNEATNAKCKLKTTGRSNAEANPAVWTDNGVSVRFGGVDWASSGWTDEGLRLINGATATIGYRPFANDVKANGLTIEMTLSISNIIDETRPIVSCAGQTVVQGETRTKGLRIQGSEIAFLTGQTVEYKNEDDEDCTREMKMTTNYVSGTRMKVALVIEPAAERKVMHLYIDGDRAAADTYSDLHDFGHQGEIVFDSTAADITLESVRIYERALSDDEVLGNHIYDIADPRKMVEVYNENAVLDQRGNISSEALRTRGKGVIRIIHVNTDPDKYGPNPLDDVYGVNNKKTDFTADVYYYSPLGADYDFVCRGCNIRIQGTSSTKYPSKNIRIYLGKGPNNSTPSLTGGSAVSGNKYRLRPGAPRMNLFTAKADYSDSSMSLNTGGAKLFNDVLKEIGLLTPPQRWQQEHGEAINVRAAIDGIPVDIFAAQSENGADVYYGQYNLNNEKAKSAKLFGMELDGFDPECPLALETLNNASQVALFQSEGETAEAVRTWMGQTAPGTDSTNFDLGCEINHAAGDGRSDGDIKWAGMTEAEQTAIVRLWKWIADCVPSGADPADPGTFVSEKFVDEVADYFDVDYLLTYYLWTEFFVSVDQRAKNILWRTWDGLKWYPTYYDGDTQRGKRNDSFMAYGPDTERDTWDAQATKWAFEGHDSWLWCLCLANLNDRLAAAAETLRSRLTVDRVLNMLLVEQSGNWCTRIFNKSGELKYIKPAVQPMYGKSSWPFIFALQGSDKQHSEWFIRQRWSLMDSKYGIGNYTDDHIGCYFNRSREDTPDIVRVTGARTYAYGYGTNNSPKLYTTGIVKAGAEAQIPITGAYTVNDPIRIYGASRITRLDLTGCCGHIRGVFDLGGCSALETLDAHVPTGAEASTSWNLANINSCKLLRTLDLRGQTDATTATGTLELDLGQLTRIESIDATGTRIALINLAAGAAVRTLRLPATLHTLVLENLPQLTNAGLTVAGYSGIRTLRIEACPGITSLTLVQTWLNAISDADTLVVRGVAWSSADGAILDAIAQKVADVTLTGTVTVTGPVAAYKVERWAAKFGNVCFTPGAALYINLAGGKIIADDTSNPEFMRQARSMGWVASSATFMTEVQAAAVTDDRFYTSANCYRGPFCNNDAVTSLDELQYFTSLTGAPQAAAGKDYGLFMAILKYLTTIKLPPHLTVISPCFARCYRLEAVTFPEGLTRITAGNAGSAYGNVYVNSFLDCEALREVHFPASLQRIECPSMFMGDTRNLKSIYFYGATPPDISCTFSYESGKAFGKGANYSAVVPDNEYHIYVPAGSAAAYMANSWIATLVNTYNFTIVDNL